VKIVTWFFLIHRWCIRQGPVREEFCRKFFIELGNEKATGPADADGWELDFYVTPVFANLDAVDLHVGNLELRG